MKWKLQGNVIASEERAWRSFQKALLLPKEEYPKGEVVCCLELFVTSSFQREEEVSRSGIDTQTCSRYSFLKLPP